MILPANKRWQSTFASLVTWLLGTTACLSGELLLVSVADEKRIAIFELTDESGELVHRNDVAVDAAPGALCSDPTGSYLFASLRQQGDLASFRIDAVRQTLVPISSVRADADPAYVATDQTGRFLLSAYYVAGKVAVHRLTGDGRIEHGGHWYQTDQKAHAILPDRSNRWILVPHTGPNAIFQFAFDARTGTLTPTSPAKTTTGSNTGPRHVDFHPTGNFVYCDNEQGSSVSAFHFDPAKGTLTRFQTESTLPADFDQRNSCAHMELSPSGRFLYAANRGHDSLAAFAVDHTTGRLSRVGIYPTERTPRSFDINRGGSFSWWQGKTRENSPSIVSIRRRGGSRVSKPTPWARSLGGSSLSRRTDRRGAVLGFVPPSVRFFLVATRAGGIQRPPQRS